MNFKIHTLVNGPLEENCYLLHASDRAEGVLIDPGSDAAGLKLALDKLGVKPVLLLATHGHFDHVGAVHGLAAAYSAPFAQSQEDAFLLEMLEDTFAMYGMGSTKEPKVDRWLKAGETLEAAGLQIKVLGTPGHTPGGLCFYHAASGSLFSGDTLFAGSVGRSDGEGASHEALIASIKRELLPLPNATVVYPGHGEASTLGAERRENRFLQ